MDNIFIIILLFFSYSFIGWANEVILSLYQHHKFINRGFLIGPICPIYGFGAIFILTLLGKYQDDPLVVFILAIAICSVLEYSTSYLMEKIFKNRWWDYTKFKFNINGRICLETMIPFGIGAIIVFYGVNPILLKLYSLLPYLAIKIIAIAFIVILIVDAILSFKVIIKLKHISSVMKFDSTELITKKVKETLFSKNGLYKRLFNSFPNMQIKNKFLILNEKLKKDKTKLKEEKKKKIS